MKKQSLLIYGIFGLVLILISCNSQTSNFDKEIIGKWSAYENDSSYVETWFDGSKILYWNEESWSYEIMFYKFDSDRKLIYTYFENSQDTVYKLNVKFADSNKMNLYNEFNVWSFKLIDKNIKQIDSNDETLLYELKERTKKANL